MNEKWFLEVALRRIYMTLASTVNRMAVPLDDIDSWLMRQNQEAVPDNSPWGWFGHYQLTSRMGEVVGIDVRKKGPLTFLDEFCQPDDVVSWTRSTDKDHVWHIVPVLQLMSRGGAKIYGAHSCVLFVSDLGAYAFENGQILIAHGRHYYDVLWTYWFNQKTEWPKVKDYLISILRADIQNQKKRLKRLYHSSCAFTGDGYVAKKIYVKHGNNWVDMTDEHKDKPIVLQASTLDMNTAIYNYNKERRLEVHGSDSRGGQNLALLLFGKKELYLTEMP